MILRSRALLVTLMLLAGCASDPDISVKHRVPHGSAVAIVMFKDCDVANQPDCDGSGLNAGTIFARVLTQRTGLHIISLPRPVGPKVALSDAAAITYAQSKKYKYVINGEVVDYLRTSHVALHSDRAGISVRVLRTSDGQALTSYTYSEDSKTHFNSPDDMLEDMAKQLATSMTTESKKQHQGDFMFYKGNSG
jgi:TolB-like protein